MQGQEGLANFARFGNQFFGNSDDGNGSGGIVIGGTRKGTLAKTEDAAKATDEKTE